MKIAIIGAGWLGCHIAYKLKKDLHNVTIIDKTDIFAGSSFFNQNRLHKGFHYSRNQRTRKLCYDTFNLFASDYRELIDDIDHNFYVIPKDTSLIDFGTFESIFRYEEVPFTKSKLSCLKNIDGSVIVNEKYIDPNKSKDFFKKHLSENFNKKEITETDINHLASEYDYVINTTNNILLPIPDCYFELSLTIVYERLINMEFGSLTMIDGPLFSIYPYTGSKYTVTDVEHTPLYTSNNISDIIQYRETIDNEMISNIRSKIEDKIYYYYDDFKTHFEYHSYYTSVKVKRKSESADRYPIIIQQDNIISCVSGKIQGIYILENFIKNEITNR